MTEKKKKEMTSTWEPVWRTCSCSCSCWDRYCCGGGLWEISWGHYSNALHS